jgi:cytochrome c oxidase assembly protein subunit 11
MNSRLLSRVHSLPCSRVPLALGRPSPFVRSFPPAPRPSSPFLQLRLSRHASTTSTPPPSPSQSYADTRKAYYARRNRSLLLYTSATVILVTAASYLAVPLYRVFCSATGYAGTPATDKSRFGADRLVPVSDSARRIRVQFNADSSDSLPWSFSPQQKEVRVLPGETALAFYTATNHSSEDIIGIATYNVTPNNVRLFSERDSS